MFRISFSGTTNDFLHLGALSSTQRSPSLILPGMIIARWFIKNLFIVMINRYLLWSPNWLISELTRCIFVVLSYLNTFLLFLTRDTLLKHPRVTPLCYLLNRFVERAIRSLRGLFRQLSKARLSIRGTLLSVRVYHSGWIITVSRLMHC